MKDFIFLKLLDKFKGIYTKFGVDYEKMRLILNMKLILDSRRASTIMGGSNKKKDGNEKNSFTMSLIMYAILGIFIGVITFFSTSIMYSFSVTFAMFMFFILTVFISDFSSVLLDVRDKNIIGTKGVDSKTINAAKITHICYYILIISLALGWLSIIGMFRFGILTGIIFILELIVVDIFMVVVTALLYLIILRSFNGEKVKDIINFIQIGLTIMMVVGYQLLGRMFDILDLEISYKSSIWNLLFPPMWFAAPLYAVNGGNIDGIIAALIFMAFIVPAIAFFLYLKNTSRFEDSLSKLNYAGRNEKEKGKGLLYRFGKHICRNNEEKAAYDLAGSIMKSEREFKLKVYPNLGSAIIFPLVFLFASTGNFSEGLNNISLNCSLNIYWFIFMIPSILVFLQYSNNYKAAWIFKSVFIQDMRNIYKGVYKAFLINMILPLYIAESIIFILIFGIKVIPVLVTAFMFLIISILIGHMAGRLKVPFTMEPGVIDKGKNMLNVLIGILIMILGAGINYAALFNAYLLIIYAIILMFIAFVMWKKCVKVY